MFDVVIIGGGLVGATTALSLVKSSPNLNVAVIEAFQAKDDAQPSFDDRSIAIAAHSADYLKLHGLLQSDAQYCEAIAQVEVSDRGHFGRTRIDKDEFAVDALGYVVEVRPWGQALHRQLKEQNITLFCPDKVSSIEQSKESVNITLNSGKEVSGKLMVVCDGAHSNTLSLLHIDTHTQDYEQTALIANIEVAQGHHNKAFERFTVNGPMALLPMTQNRYSLVWCVPQEKQQQLLALDEATFIAELQSEFGYRAGVFKKVGMRAAYPLKVGRPERLIHHRVAVIGNAAHIVHPIAGQGFNLGLRDTMVLQSLISEAHKKQQDIGSITLLNQYQVERNQDIDHVLWLTDALVRSFSNQSRAIALMRSIGLGAMASCSRLKAPLAKQLMGNVG